MSVENLLKLALFSFLAFTAVHALVHACSAIREMLGRTRDHLRIAKTILSRCLILATAAGYFLVELAPTAFYTTALYAAYAAGAPRAEYHYAFYKPDTGDQGECASSPLSDPQASLWRTRRWT